MKKKLKKIAVIIPCHNEEQGIGVVIDKIPVNKLKTYGFDTQVIVVNNNSTDRTARIALNKKVILVDAVKKGKGHAIKTGFSVLEKDVDYVVMMDGDDTYKGYEILRMIEPLESNFADVVIGSRLGGKLLENSLNIHHRMANWGYTFLVRHFYNANVTDVLSGYFAWKKPVVDTLLLHLESKGFAIEMEMITKMVRLGYYMCSVPITYGRRKGNSKIEAMKDGTSILYMFFKNLFWKPIVPQTLPKHE